MKNEMVALPVYQERISPLFDVAKKFAIFELEEGEIKQKLIVDIHAEAETQRLEKLREIGVSVIISGAVSGFIARLVVERGMRLYSWASGPVDEVILHYINNDMKSCCTPPSGARRGGRRRGCSGRGPIQGRGNNFSEENQ